MAMSFTFSVLENSARNLIVEVVGIDAGTVAAYTSDGTSAGILANQASYTPTVHAKLRRIVYNTTNCMIRLQWHQTTNAEAVNFSGYGEMNLKDEQGLIQPGGTGATGDVDITSYAIGAVTSGTGVVSAACSFTLYFIKGA